MEAAEPRARSGVHAGVVVDGGGELGGDLPVVAAVCQVAVVAAAAATVNAAVDATAAHDGVG